MSRGVALLVASNDTHVSLFAPIAAALDHRGVTSSVVSLDPYYGQGASAASRQASLDVIELQRRRAPRSEQRFYARPVLDMWLDALDARRALERLIADRGPSFVLLGNDHGLLEKAAIREARRAGAMTILVQDGRLAPRPRLRGMRAWLTRTAKGWLSPALRAAGVPYLAASDYGSGGTDLVCASGDAGAEILRARSTRGSRIVVTGQPRYDRLMGMARRREPPRWDVVVFTTPFAAAGLGADVQAAQEALVLDLHRWALDTGRRLAVKPHPRERGESYSQLRAHGAVLTGDAAEAMVEARVAVIGMSTVLDEAAVVGTPVVVPGAVVHRPGMDGLLPPRDPYARGESLPELISLIEAMDDSAARADALRRQAEYARRQLFTDPASTAAERIVAAMLGS